MQASERRGALTAISATIRELGGTHTGTDPMRFWYAQPTHKKWLPDYAYETVTADCWTVETARDLTRTAWMQPEWPAQLARHKWATLLRDTPGGMLCDPRDDHHEPCTVHDGPVRVWRAAFHNHRDGLSWTLDETVAEWFAARGDMAGTGRVMRVWTVVIPPERVWAHFTQRAEQELACDVTGLTVSAADG